MNKRPLPPEVANPTTSYGAYEAVRLNHYRRPKDIPHADPWYYHGLFKLAPTQHWDDGTRPDYAFGKVAGNYRAYVGAMRAVLTMRYLLGGVAAGRRADLLVMQAQKGDDGQLYDPPGAFRIAETHKPKEFLAGYITNFGGKLPVVTLDLQKFDDGAWGGLRSLCRDGVEWDKRMGGWGGPGAGQGGTADNSQDFFITGLRLQGQGPEEGRPSFTPIDFLYNHLPSTTSSQDKAQDALRRMTTDAFWDPLLPDDSLIRGAAHTLLDQLRQELEHDYRFARKYGYILFLGDKFGRSPTIMEE